VPYIYIDKLFNELKAELLSAMHQAVERELHNGRIDPNKLLRSFTRAAAGKMSNPVQVSDKCIEEHGIRPKKGSKANSSD